MEGIISQRVTPILKCMVLFLFIFTAKVLTSRPHDSQDSKNEIHQYKSPHYVRTFTKYHHRRPILKNTVQDANYWPEVKAVGKRSVDIPYSNDFISPYWPLLDDENAKKKIIRKRSVDLNSNFGVSDWPESVVEKRSLDMQEFVQDSDETKMSEFASNTRDIVGSFEKTAISSSKNTYETKNSLSSNQVEKHKVKAAIIVTDPPTTPGPSITCLYKVHSVSKSVTPSYEDEANAQMMVENDSYVTGPISETTLANGDVVEVEQCAHPRPYCYTLWHQDDAGNITVLGQETGPISETTLSNGDVVEVEQCAHPRPYCYTLWHQDDAGNITVLAQGCWHSSQGRSSCDKCTSVQALLPGSKFCCCTHSLCNADFLSLKMETVTIQAESTMDSSQQQPNYSNILASSILALAALLVTAVLLRRFYCGRAREKDDISLCADVEKVSLKMDTVTIQAESTMDSSQQQPNYSNILASSILALAALLVTAVLLRRFYCGRAREKDDISLCADVEKGDVIGSGPDALATGLLCVDNLTLIEHIGQGKFGSVWRGSLGSTPVAVKLYSAANAWQKEAAVYSHTMTAHENLLRYYGSDTRPTLTEDGGRQHLIVLELCPTTLRRRLEQQPLTWIEFATIAHGLASALAHLHSSTPMKPCIVHRDVNSSNVLISARGHARLADLGLAQMLHPQRGPRTHTRISEAGTLRYLSPEALEGALDLSYALGALCAVDVFALALVLWEMLWRCAGAHRGPAPPYTAPYAHLGLADCPTLHQMQSLVSRNKARPPLPRGPVPEARALKIASDTCDECWDHDAEARLTAVCVEERMAELKQMLQTQGPVIHDNNLHPHPPDATNIHQESDKNSNCTTNQTCDVTTPLLYPHPHIGRNACIERNTHTQTHTVELIHKSLKDITTTETHRQQNIEENCLSVARVTHRPIPEHSMNEIRSYQRPLDYIPNDVTNHDVDRGPKQTNLLNDVKIEKPKWGIKRFFERYKNQKDTEVKLVPESSVQNGRTQTSVIEKPTNFDRPTNLVLSQERTPYNFEVPCTLSPPNRTLSPTMMMESDMNRENRVFNFKELPAEDGRNPRTPNQIFAVIVPKSKPAIESRQAGSSSESINKYKSSISSQSIFKSGNSESEDSTVKKRLSCDNKIIDSNSGRSSRASINLELQYINGQTENYTDSPFDVNSDCSSSEDEHLMLLSENGGSKITMQTISKDTDKKKYQNEVLKEASQVTDFGFNKFQNKYTNFDNEFSDPNDKENLVTYSGDNPVYLAALNGEIDTNDLKYLNPDVENSPKSPKPSLKSLSIKRQHSLEQVSEIFSSSGDINLQNPAGRVKTPGDLPVAVRRARRDRALQKGRASECNRLSLYDDRMMFGNSL